MAQEFRKLLARNFKRIIFKIFFWGKKTDEDLFQMEREAEHEEGRLPSIVNSTYPHACYTSEPAHGIIICGRHQLFDAGSGCIERLPIFRAHIQARIRLQICTYFSAGARARGSLTSARIRMHWGSVRKRQNATKEAK
jgi:hypothetical protein